MGEELSQKKCIPCQGGVSPLKGEELQSIYKQLQDGWQVVNEHHLEKTFNFKDYREAVAFTNRVAELANEEDHHPDLLLTYDQVKITLWTHKIDGLSESDFIFAAKAEKKK